MLYHASVALGTFVPALSLTDVGIGAGARGALIGTLLGWSGVDLFFVLSGFLITRILLRTQDAPRYFGPFYARRALRILPLYFAVLAFFFFWVAQQPSLADYSWTTQDPPSQLWYWGFLSNVVQGLRGEFLHASLAITWSLAIEEQFYLVWPAVVRAVRGRAFPVLCGVLIVAALVLRIVLVEADAAFTWVYTLPVCRMDALAAGALVAWCLRGGSARLWCRRVAMGALPVGLVAVALIVGAIVGGATAQERTATIFIRDPWMLTVGLTVWTVVFASTVALLAGARESLWSARPFAAAPLRLLGRHSYALYLVHAPILYFVATAVFHPQVEAGAQGRLFGDPLAAYGTFALIGLALALIPAYLAWVVIERPLLSLKRRVPYAPAPPND